MFAIRVSWPKDSIHNVCHSSFLARRQYLQCLPFEFLGQMTVFTMSARRQHLQCLPFEFLGQKTVFTMSAIGVPWPKDSIYNVCHSSSLAKRQYLQCLPLESLGQKTVITMSAILLLFSYFLGGWVGGGGGA